ncbi:lipoprotein [Spiroplasma ixodetis]|uniref:Lipoprotein n=1 Tax=Spiroplasma ixodetis TaxID=2141 RepID=A0ABM8JK94_9MOLU
MKKLLSILGAITLIGTTSTSVIACGGRNEPSPTSDTRTDLNTVIIKNELGIIYIGQLDKTNKTEILKAIKDKNKEAIDLTEDDFDFEYSPTATTATIIGKNNYEGKVSFNFTISMFKNINNSGIPQHITIERILKINNLIYVSTNYRDNKNVYKSTDGSTFTALAGTSGSIWSLAVDSNNNVYAGSYNGNVYKSTDGYAFTALTGTSGSIWSLAVDSNNGNVYAGSYNGNVYKSTDGSTFTALAGTSGSIRSLAVDSNNNVYAGSYNGNVYKSTDGSTFKALTGTSGSIRSLAVDSNNNVYAGSDNGNVYKSTDGSTFTALTGTSGSIWSLAVDSNNGNVYAGSDNGNVYKSTDGSTFTALTGTSGSIWSLAVDSNNGNVYAAGRADEKPSLFISERL